MIKRRKYNEEFKMNLVSIIIPVFNSAGFVNEAILSVKKQTYPYWEIIIVDDCSIDETEQVIRKLCEKDEKIHYFRLAKNSGAAVARNLGIQKSKGKYIAFLDSDDKWVPDKLSTQIAVMEEKNYNFTYTDYVIMNQKTGKSIQFDSIMDKVIYADEVKFNYIACSTVIFNQEVLGKHYMPDLRNRQDWGLWISLLTKTEAAYRVKEKLTIYLQRKNSISSSKFKMIKYHWLIYRKFLKKRFIHSIYLLSINVVLHWYYGQRKK